MMSVGLGEKAKMEEDCFCEWMRLWCWSLISLLWLEILPLPALPLPVFPFFSSDLEFPYFLPYPFYMKVSLTLVILLFSISFISVDL